MLLKKLNQIVAIGDAIKSKNRNLDPVCYLVGNKSVSYTTLGMKRVMVNDLS